MSYKPSIDILLATYNGQKYLAEQINSILTQSHQDWQLLIRDDGSVDDTVNIIKRYVRQYPHKIKMITDNFNHLGAKLNFGKLLEHAQADYIMFCDQDDVWLPRKIEVTLRVMQAAEKNYPNKPIMVHSDSIIVDDNLKVIAGSKWAYEKIWPSKNDNLNRIILQNVATGCTVMINERAKNVSLPISEDAIMHDWWIAIKVAKYGKIVHTPDKLILHRQHSNNLVGAKKGPTMNIWEYLVGLPSLKEKILKHYRMVKIYKPHSNFCLFIIKKVLHRIVQNAR
jgi:glycosyltransferase involved in cell wall biosynthesis